MKLREAALAEAGDLQEFLRDLDEFQAWLSKTMTTVASEDIPESLKEAEQLLNKHAAIKEEIDGYEEKYAKLKEEGDRITEGQTDTQYMFLKQVIIRRYQEWDLCVFVKLVICDSSNHFELWGSKCTPHFICYISGMECSILTTGLPAWKSLKKKVMEICFHFPGLENLGIL